MTENKIIIPIWKKSNLTVEEAAAYCGIGSRKLREMSDSEFCPFVLWNGSKRLIKRRKLDEYNFLYMNMLLHILLSPYIIYIIFYIICPQSDSK